MTKSKSKLIGEGSSGCVFKPALPCKSEDYDKNNKQVSKLVFSENYSQELKMNQYIQNIPDHNQWCSIFTQSCKSPNLNKLQKISMIEDCLEEKEFQKVKGLLIGDYAGISLQQYFEKTFSKQAYHSIPLFTKAFKKFIPKIKSLFVATQQLHHHNICHNDLNYRNITFKKDRFYLIDFGVSGKFTDMNRFKKRINRELKLNRIYLSYPYEYILMTQSDKLKKDKSLFENKEFKDNHDIYQFIHEKIFQRKNINQKIKDGFIRSKLINSSINGKVTFNPNFFLKLELNPSTLNMEKLFPLIQKKYFSENNNALPLIKKINGFFKFESKFQGRVVTENGEITFKDFKIGKNFSINFNAKITEFGERGKIQFNVTKTFQHKTNLSNKIEIKGYIIPTNEKVVFQNFLLNNSSVSDKKIKVYEDKFEKEVIQKSLKNIFNEKKLNKYFKNLIKTILA